MVVAYGLILPPAALAAAAARLPEHPRLAAAALARAPRPSNAPCWPATPRPASPSCSSTQASTPARAARAPPADRPHDTAGDLHDALAELGAAALLEAIEGLAARHAAAARAAGRGVTYAAKIEKAEARIDWNDGAVQLDRKIRAFNPWPMAETLLRRRAAAAAARARCRPRARGRRARDLVRHWPMTACAWPAARACSRSASCSAPANGRYRRAISPMPCVSRA